MPRPVNPTGEEARSLVSRLGPLEVDWPKSIAYFGGLALAVAFDVISPPVGLFIAGIPIGMLFRTPGRGWPLRIITEGPAKPGADGSEARVRVARRKPNAAEKNKH